MIADGKAGQNIVQDGAESELRLGRYGALAMMSSHARYYDAVVRGNVFVASLQSAVALGTALTATAVTFTLYNPAGSGKNLVIMQTSLAVVVATTAGFVVYAVNGTPGQAVPATVTVLASGIQNALVGGGSNPTGVVYSAATLPAAPVARRVLGGIISTTPGGVHTIVDQIDGGIVLTPNMAVTIQGITTNATGVIGMVWEEVLT
jgi:hypothetical protein